MSFQLEPFGGLRERAALGLEGMRLSGEVKVERQAERATLRIRYQLRHDLHSAAVAIEPPSGGPPSRRDGLWQHTCLEAFLAGVDGEAYWELNLAPSGDWALYRFDTYRQGQQSPALEALPFTVESCRDRLELSLSFNLPSELATARLLELGISAVLELQSGAISYWSLHHPAAQPDFHDRKGFVLRL